MARMMIGRDFPGVRARRLAIDCEPRLQLDDAHAAADDHSAST